MPKYKVLVAPAGNLRDFGKFYEWLVSIGGGEVDGKMTAIWVAISSAGNVKFVPVSRSNVKWNLGLKPTFEQVKTFRLWEEIKGDLDGEYEKFRGVQGTLQEDGIEYRALKAAKAALGRFMAVAIEAFLADPEDFKVRVKKKRSTGMGEMAFDTSNLREWASSKDDRPGPTPQQLKAAGKRATELDKHNKSPPDRNSVIASTNEASEEPQAVEEAGKPKKRKRSSKEKKAEKRASKKAKRESKTDHNQLLPGDNDGQPRESGQPIAGDGLRPGENRETIHFIKGWLTRKLRDGTLDDHLLDTIKLHSPLLSTLSLDDLFTNFGSSSER